MDDKPQKVEVVGLDIPFGQLVLLFIKLAPAFIIALVALVIMTIVLGMFIDAFMVAWNESG